MTGHSIRKLCILVAVIAWVILFMGLITTGLKYSIVKCSVVHMHIRFSESTHQEGLSTFN